MEHAHEHRQEEDLEEDDEDHGIGEAEETACGELDVSQSGAEYNMNIAEVTLSLTSGECKEAQIQGVPAAPVALLG